MGLVLSGPLAAASDSGRPSDASVCGSPQNRQFDFWAGDWDVFDYGSPVKVASARVDVILSGCVLHEDYRGADGHQGESFTTYDPIKRSWHQSWVTNRGETLELQGKFDSGKVELTGEDHKAGTIVRGWWKPEKSGVRETAVTSADGGKSWKPWFDIMFSASTNHVANGASVPRDDSSRADAEKAVANLDTEYQAAVKKNDAATMNRILADDFVLVTGSGNTYDKADLLTEARSARVQYELQDDSEQKVRVWGDTAVITAKLREKGTEEGRPFDKTVWFSDTYVRTSSGWRYVFGQSSLPLP
jgi:ketosteroid isomerase-like protein